jgi:hypothetical protein
LAKGDGSRRRGKTATLLPLCAVTVVIAPVFASTVGAVTPESPEVRKLVHSALGYLEKNTDSRLGGQCLIGLTFLKAGRPDHPRVREALEACRETMRANPPDHMPDVYSNGLAIILLCELSAQEYAREIEWYLARMEAIQMPHGGWGYQGYVTGDTSQTQYAALSYWEADRRGFDIPRRSIEKLADWLLRTQGPDGCWGYQGQVSTTGQPVLQSETSCSMLAAGLGCVYICADLLGISRPTRPADWDARGTGSIPAALRPIEPVPQPTGNANPGPQQLNVPPLTNAMARAQAWMNENYRIDIGVKRYYYLYGLERYKSFQEAAEGVADPEPKWYRDGYEFLAEDQAADGSWRGYCGAECDTAFAVLFLLRSTQKSLRDRLAEGTLLAGRGLPANLSRAKLRNGQVIVEQMQTQVGELLSMIEDDDAALLDELAQDPGQLMIEEVDSQNARRLQQLVRGGEPKVRLLAVRALGRTGNLDYVPSLLYALTDPDRQIVLEARDGLRFISRNFAGFGPPDDFTQDERYEAVDAWKKWYQSLRPAAALEP